jgi:hypothetical protein
MVVPAAVSNGLRDADSIRARQRCEIFVTLRVFLNRVTVERAFSAVMSSNHNEWGSHANGAASMHQSTWVVLFLLMFGEIAVLAVAGFILWIMGGSARIRRGGTACAVCASGAERNRIVRLRVVRPLRRSQALPRALTAHAFKRALAKPPPPWATDPVRDS